MTGHSTVKLIFEDDSLHDCSSADRQQIAVEVSFHPSFPERLERVWDNPPTYAKLMLIMCENISPGHFIMTSSGLKRVARIKRWVAGQGQVGSESSAEVLRAMTPERSKLLGELLSELGEDADGVIPDAAWLPVQKTFSLPYVEVAIVRRGPDCKIQILLTHRADQYWRGWQIPGGLWRTRQTLEDCVASLVRTELSEDARVKLIGQGTWEKWHDHPHGWPISHVVICSAENVPEIESIRWFSEVPAGMIDDHGHHARFVRNTLDEAESLI